MMMIWQILSAPLESIIFEFLNILFEDISNFYSVEHIFRLLMRKFKISNAKASLLRWKSKWIIPHIEFLKLQI